jgi:large subunit ribosomal protein L1
MGKIRIRTIGIEEIEQEEKIKQKEKKEKKKTAKAPGLKGGERVVAVGSSIEELEKEIEEKKEEPAEKGKKGKEKKKRVKKARSLRHIENKKLVDKTLLYSPEEAVKLLKRMKPAGFDETVELHLNLLEKGSFVLQLPQGTGKKIRAAIADDALIEKIQTGKIDFDILFAHPSMMPKLAKVAKILGPRGLMPNPKNGTITTNPQEEIKKLSGGQLRVKTESQAPILHLVCGKLSFGEKELVENIKAVISSIGINKIKSATLNSTMSPGIKISLK